MELKPCPFCGNEKIKYDYTYISHGIRNFDIYANKHFVGLEFRVWCFCEGCHAKSGDVVDFFNLDFIENKNWLEIAKNKLYPIATEAWNRRANDV